MKKILFIILAIVFSVFSFATEIKNVILFIGDGMGENHVVATSFLEKKELNMLKANFFGYIQTHSLNNEVTDSAAAATALATGYKTNNGMIGMLPNGEVIPNLAEILSKNGYKTGIVVTCRVTHATPAGFYGHVASRDEESKLAKQLVDSNLTVVFGGGVNYFKDLEEDLKFNRFDYLKTKQEMISYVGKKGKKVIGLFNDDHLHPVTQRPSEEPFLPEMTQKAIEILSKDGGPFFLMVEGSQIDTRSHENNLDGVLKEVLEFDESIGIALEFAEKNPDTLVLVTADHETGGLILNVSGLNLSTKRGLSTPLGGSQTVDLETMKTFQSRLAKVIYSSSDIEELKTNIEQSFEVTLTPEEMNYIESSQDKQSAVFEVIVGKANCAAKWSTTEHTDELVPVFAFGPGAEKFSKILDNTDVPKIILELLEIEVSSSSLIKTH
ncbi:MAG TPA: alkaline phosphatase [Defluviitoga sp.]|nr:alkaline phosphatase [Defluviitoga sp.]HOP23890.1 alkaline phosphatase [Defluviitoga sp.]HPZ29271.1 alkaline phosphatase [Defluviitoga sp.]HQD62462.1 alkaline phosphatase [Defluviitoga sp.]